MQTVERRLFVQEPVYDEFCRKFADGLEAGMAHINDCTLHDEPTAPVGGVKNSGFGRENGCRGIEEMTEVKWIPFRRGRRPFPF